LRGIRLRRESSELPVWRSDSAQTPTARELSDHALFGRLGDL